MVLLFCERVFHIGIFDPGAGRRPGAVPAPLLVLLASRCLHHGAARPWASSANWSPSSRASRSSATASSRTRAWRSRYSASWSGAITCSSATQSVYAGLVFSFLSYFVAIPSAIKVFNWTATLYKGSISFDTPMLYAFGFIGLFTIGGLTGLFLAVAGLRRPCHRHLLRDRALPLHHGGRHHHGLPGRPALLVAQDDRPHVSGRLGQALRAGHLPRLQPDLLPAIHSGLHGNAAALRTPTRRSSRCCTCSPPPALRYWPWAT